MVSMNKRNLIFAGAALLFAMVAIGSLCSCKGRTMKNMEPTGDTVEVNISPLPQDIEEDTVAGFSSAEPPL